MKTFKPAPGKAQVLVCAPYGPTFSKVVEKLGSDPEIEVIECESVFEAVPFVKALESCVLLAHVSQQEHVVKVITGLKLLAETIARRQPRILITLHFDLAIFEEKFKRYGATEVIREPVTDKSLSFKVLRYARPLISETKRATHSRKTREPEKGALAGEAAGATAGEQKEHPTGKPPKIQNRAEAQVRFVDPLAIESDCWLYDGGSARRVGGRWMVRLRGPGPLSGRWHEIEGDGPGYRCWQWMPQDPESDPFIKEEGAWVFKGLRQPYAQDDSWTFVGENPVLAFYYEGESYGAKFKQTPDGSLSIANDSRIAQESESQMRATWQRVIKTDTKDSFNSQIKKVEKTEDDKAYGRSESGKARGQQIVFVDPLILDSDCWLYESAQANKFSGQWAIRMKGPGPLAGEWAEIQGERRGSERAWQWVPKDPGADPFVKEEGAWVFRGLCPKLKGDIWLFTSKRPELSFYYEGESYGDKLSIDAKEQLVVARNSQAAKDSELAIEASFDQIFQSKDDPAKAGGMLGEGKARLAKEGEEFEVVRDESPSGEINDKRTEDAEKAPVADYVDVQEKKEGAADYVDTDELASRELNDQRKPDEAGPGLQDRRGKSDPAGGIELDGTFASAIVDRLKKGGAKLPEGALETLAKVQKTFEAPKPRDAEKEAAKPKGPAAVQAKKPPGPTLGPLALAFLMSELMSRRQFGNQYLAQRFCEYVSASCGGLRAELWVFQRKKWVCAATSDQAPGKLIYLLKALKAGGHEKGPDSMAAAIATEEKSVVGALAISGEGATGLSSDYLLDAGATVLGLMASLLQTNIAAPAVAA